MGENQIGSCVYKFFEINKERVLKHLGRKCVQCLQHNESWSQKWRKVTEAKVKDLATKEGADQAVNQPQPMLLRKEQGSASVTADSSPPAQWCCVVTTQTSLPLKPDVLIKANIL